ncbi:hypothetical protein ACFWUS_07700, partial [Streptomyces cyaneofuscatus]
MTFTVPEATRVDLDLDGRRLSFLDFGGPGRPLPALHGHISEGRTFAGWPGSWLPTGGSSRPTSGGTGSRTVQATITAGAISRTPSPDGRRLSFLDFGGPGRPLPALHGHISEGRTFAG